MWQVRIDVRARYVGQDYVNTYMYEKGGIIGRVDGPNRLGLDPQLPQMETSDVEFLRAAFVDLWRTRYENLCTTQWTATELRIAALSPDPSFRRSWSFPLTWTGTAAPPGIPPGQAVIVTRRPNPGQRFLNGRLYYGCFPQADVLDGVVATGSGSETFLTAMATALSIPIFDPAAPPPVGVNDWNPMVIQFRRFDPLHTTFPSAGIVPGQALFKRALRSYRRRRAGHGRAG